MSENARYLLNIQVKVQNDPALEQASKDLAKINEVAGKATKTTNDYGRANKRMGNIAQNTGYQISDLIVQIQGGQDPMRALGQQLPQLAVGFGAVGAAIGVLGAAIPAAITYFRESGEAAYDLDDALEELYETVNSAPMFTQSIDLKSWIDEWNKATEAIRETELAYLTLENTRSSAALQESITAIAENTAEEAGSSWWQSFLASAAKASTVSSGAQYNEIGENISEGMLEQTGLQNLQETFGISRIEAQKLLDIMEEFGDGSLGAQDATDQLVAIELGAEGATQSMRDLVDQMRGVAEAAKNLEERQGLQALAEGGGTLAGGTPKKKRRTHGLDPFSKELIAELNDEYDELAKKEKERIAYNKESIALWQRFNPELAEFADTVNALGMALDRGAISQEKFDKASADALDTLNDEFSLMEYGIDSFQKSFETMLDGVLMGTQDISSGFKDMGKVVIAQLLKIMAYQAIFKGLGGSSNSFLSTIGNAFNPAAAENGAVLNNGAITAFAKGGISKGPTFFANGGTGVGLLGESGPEAIMPLGRNSKGELGVKGGGMSVVVNNMASGVEVQPRQTDQGLTLDIVMRAVGQAFQAGGNDVSDSVERTYGLGRGRGVY